MIVADADGILVIPPAIVAEVADEVVEQERQDTFVFRMVQEGNKVDGLFPMNAEWKARYDEWVAGGAK